MVSIPGLGRFLEIGNGNPLLYCLENFMDRGPWQATVHGVPKSWTRVSDLAHTYMYVCVCKYICVCTKELQSCLTLWPYGLLPARLFCPWNSPGKNTGVGCYFLLQGIFPIQGSNPAYPAWQMGSLTNSTTWEAQSHVYPCLIDI